MKKNKLTMLLMCVMFVSAACATKLFASEITVIIKPINPFQFGQQQVFMPVTILNNGSSEHELSIQVQISTARGELVGDFRSTSFKSKPGTMDLSAASPLLVASSYPNSKFRDYVRANATFPSGNYSYCINLTIDGIMEDKTCESFELQALNPAQLIYPENHSAVEDFGLFQFSWMPCTPPRSQVFYSFKVVEVFEGQSPAEAINRNPALHKIMGLGISTYSYPVNAPKFETGKSYAWQIECYEDLSLPEYQRDVNGSVSSVVYDFHLRGEEIQDSSIFVKPKRTLDAGFSRLQNGKLYFTFSSNYLDGQLNFSFKDNNLKDIPVRIRRIDEGGVLSESAVVMIGENKYVMELTGTRPPEGIYTLELKDLKGITYYLKVMISVD